jgi:hypothetical protein
MKYCFDCAGAPLIGFLLLLFAQFELCFSPIKGETNKQVQLSTTTTSDRLTKLPASQKTIASKIQES